MNNKIVYSGRATHRTQNALPNMREKAREAFIYFRDNKCTCGCGIMVDRINKVKNTKFKGCTNYPVCKNTKF